MNSNIINEYTDYVKKEFLVFYRIILQNKYNKQLIENFIECYIKVRYFNETKYSRIKDFVSRISKELKEIINQYIGKPEEDIAKTVFATFSYLFYFDDCFYIEDTNQLIEVLSTDETIKLNLSKDMKKEIRELIKRFNNNKERFYHLFESKDFSISEKIIRKNLYTLRIEEDVKVSSLYSDSARRKAFNTGIINEDKLFVILLMASYLILENAISLDFSRYYVVDVPCSFFSKEKKFKRLLNNIDNILAKKHLIINFNYKDYIDNKDIIENLIYEGYSISLIISETFDEDYSKLVLFSRIFVDKKSDFYDRIMENKENYMATIVAV